MSRDRTSDALPRWPTALLALAVAFALYLSTLAHPFLTDDVVHIVGNPTIAQLSTTGLVRLWTTPYLKGIRPDGTLTTAPDPNPYRPVTTASFWVNAGITGVRAPWFRAVNIALHALAAWLVGVLAARWCGAQAGIVALAIVLLHPIATDVINRVTGRGDILVVVGVAGFLAAQRGAQRDGWTWPRTLLAALAAAVALGAKESGVVIVPLALLQEWLGRAVSGPRASPPRHTWRGLAALGVPALLYAAGRLTAVGMPGFTRSHYDLLESPLPTFAFAERLPASLALAWDYWRRLVVPWPLMALDYPERFPRWSDATPWAGLVVLVVLTTLLAVSLRRHPAVALGVAWCLGSYFVVSHLLVPTWTYREIRLAYPIMAGAALAVGAAAARVSWRGRAARTLAAMLTLAAVILVLRRNAEMTSDMAIAEADVRHRPLAASAHVKLGDMLDLAGRMDEAGRAYEHATTLAPWSYQAWYQLAAFRERQARYDDARRAYERAAAVDPSFPFAFLGLGVLDINAGDLTAAARHLAAAERADPDDPNVQYNLAVVDDKRGRSAAAQARLERLVARRPDFRLAVEGLAQLHGQ